MSEELDVMCDGGGFTTDEDEEYERRVNILAVKGAEEISSTEDEGEIRVIQPDLEAISSEEEFCERVVTIVRNKKPVFITDGVVGGLDSKDVISRVFKSQSTEQIVTSVLNEYTDLNRVFLWSIGNVNLTSTECSNLGSIDKMPDKVISDLKIAYRAIKKAGGIMEVTSLIPNPAEVEPSVSKNPTDIQSALSKAFVELTTKIYMFNERHGMTTPHLKVHLESRTYKERNGHLRIKKMFIKGREQRKILIHRFQDDRVKPREVARKKLVEICRKEMKRLIELKQ